jgi:hypothetical protein
VRMMYMQQRQFIGLADRNNGVADIAHGGYSVTA